MSEFAKAILKLPVSPERETEERERKRLFHKQKAALKDAILHDRRLSRTQRLIGYEIGDRLNFKTGYAWPSQELIAEKVRCDERTVRRAMLRLCDEQSDGWFRRELDGKNYCYHPRFERLNEPPAPVDNTGHLEHQTPDIHGGQNVRLSSLIEPCKKENPSGACGEAIRLPPPTRKSDGSKTDDRRRKVFDFGSQDELITIAARAEGKRAFVFYDSKPWRLWNEYRTGQGLPPLQIQQTRQHMVDGVLRVGVDMPTVYPPGYGRHCTPRVNR